MKKQATRKPAKPTRPVPTDALAQVAGSGGPISDFPLNGH